MFIALLFLPLMRWLGKKKVSKPVRISIVILIIIGVLKRGGELIQLATNEIILAKGFFFVKRQKQNLIA